MTSVTIEEAQARLPELIGSLPPGDELVITKNDLPVATLRVPAETPPAKPRQLGTQRGSVLYIAADFDAIPEGFEEYVE